MRISVVILEILPIFFKTSNFYEKKITLPLFLTLICSFGKAQKSDVVNIDSLPPQGILLEKGWKWHTGNNPNFAKANFDDSKWENIDPSLEENGTGINDETKVKIFQPFFNTKPTGQGTGFGLSLAYDIVTKGLGGTLEVESMEGEGTTFIVIITYIKIMNRLFTILIIKLFCIIQNFAQLISNDVALSLKTLGLK